MFDLKTLISVVVAFALGQASNWYWAQRKARAEDRARLRDINDVANQKLIDRIVTLEHQQSSIMHTVLPLSTAFQAILVKELTHFHTPNMDRLLAKLGPPYTLTPEEEDELAQGLQERIVTLDGAIDTSEREAAIILPYVMRRVKSDVAALTAIDLVIVPRELLNPRSHEAGT